MKCPKCNTKLSKNAIKCPSCGIRIGRLCPKCKQYNLITNKNCTNCNETLLVICPECKSINLPNSKKCRKCNAPLPTNENVNIKNVSYNANYQTLSTAKELIMEYIKSDNVNIISINGENDYAKNYVFKKLMKETSADGTAWLMGECTPHTQLTPLGYIQNVLLNLFNTTNFCISKKQLKNDSMNFFKNDFPTLSSSEINDLLNILYPESIDSFKNIEKNKQKTIKMIAKVFEVVLAKMNTILLVENVEYIDSFSHEIINILLQNKQINNKLTIIITFTKEQSGINFFNQKKLKNNYRDITIAPFTKEQIETVFLPYKDLKINNNLKSKIISCGHFNPTLTEQLINIVSDSIKNNEEIKLFDNLHDTLKYRLDTLKKNDYNSYLILCASAVAGYIFSPIVFTPIFNMSYSEVENIIEKLSASNYIKSTPNSCYKFKTLNIWKNIIKIIKNDKEIFRAVNQALYQLIPNYLLSAHAINGYISQNLGLYDLTLEIWTKCIGLAAYIGDIGLYIVLQKHILLIIDNIDNPNKETLKRKLYSELGKLLEANNPKMALEYLPKAVMLYDDTFINEKIELLGYLASASIKMGKSHSAIECIEKVLNYIPKNNKTECAIITSRKLKPLGMLGNYGAIVNIADNDVLPILEKSLSEETNSNLISQDGIFYTLIKTYLNLIQALIIQGDNRAFKVIETVTDICRANKISEQSFWLRLNILSAFANTMFGNITSSIKILDEILSEEEPDEISMSKINLLNILNKYFMNKNDLSYDELFQATKFADDINDNFTKNILKLILGKLIHDRTSTKDAMTIYVKQTEYFAEQQNAIGVLLGWYFVSEAKLSINGPNEALDVATKALDIAQSANISNYYFILLFNKLFAKIYITLKDYDSAKMYLEKALLISKKYNIKYQTAYLYILYSKYLQDFALTISDNKLEYIKNAKQTLQKAFAISEELKSISLSSDIEKANSDLNNFCQTNNITLPID